MSDIDYGSDSMMPLFPSVRNAITSEHVRVLFIPEWVKLVFDRNKRDYIDLFDYSIVRQLLSIEDIAEFVAVNCFHDHPILWKFSHGYYAVDAWTKEPVDRKLITEFRTVISPLIESLPIRKRILDRLTLPSTDPQSFNADGSPNDDYFSVVVAKDHTIFVHVKPGLINALTNSDYVRQIATTYVKALYSLISIPNVSSYEAFGVYLASL